MKKIMLNVILITQLILAVSACKTAEKYTCPDLTKKVDINIFKGGWCDENSYMTPAWRELDTNIKDIKKRNAKALELAALTAQVLFIDHFKDRCYPVNGACGLYDPAEAAKRDAIIKTITDAAKAGTVVYNDCDDEGCTVIFKISKPELKKFFESCAGEVH